MITTTMSGDGQAGRGETCEECAKAGANQGPHTFILARETRCSRIKHMSMSSTVQPNPSLTGSQVHELIFGSQETISPSFPPHLSLLPLVSVSRCQFPVSDVTTCCDQACTPGGYLAHSVTRHLAQSPVLECGASAGIRQAEKHPIDHDKEDLNIDTEE